MYRNERPRSQSGSRVTTTVVDGVRGHHAPLQPPAPFAGSGPSLTPFAVPPPYERIPESTLKVTQAGRSLALGAVEGGRLR